MNRRDFLKVIGLAPIFPSVLTTVPQKALTLAAVRKFVNEKVKPDGGRLIEIPVGYALEDIPTGLYGWVQITCTYGYDL